MNPDMVFTSLYHHVADIDNLRECYQALKGNKAIGVDDVTKSMYAEDLEANLQDLSARLNGWDTVLSLRTCFEIEFMWWQGVSTSAQSWRCR